MADVLTSEQRQRNMRNIHGKNTKPELLLRRALHKCGLRYRLYGRDLPGCPDLVLPRYRTVIFVHGCFWHRHGCAATSTPATRPEFWKKKFADNVARDKKAVESLLANGWRVIIVWECALKDHARKELPVLCEQIVHTLRAEKHCAVCMQYPPSFTPAQRISESDIIRDI